MEDQEILEQQPQPTPSSDEAYENLLKEFNNMKQNTVSKDKYDKVMERNKQLSEAYINNLQMQDNEQPQAEKPDIDKLRQELVGDSRKDMTNLDFIDKSLKLRQAVIDSGGRDPFLPTGGPDKDSMEAIHTAEKVANGLQQMVDEADGNPEAFRALYQARVEDIRRPGRNLR